MSQELRALKFHVSEMSRRMAGCERRAVCAEAKSERALGLLSSFLHYAELPTDALYSSQNEMVRYINELAPALLRGDFGRLLHHGAASCGSMCTQLQRSGSRSSHP